MPSAIRVEKQITGLDPHTYLLGSGEEPRLRIQVLLFGVSRK